MPNLKISQLTADTTPTHDDLLVTVNDPAGTPANKKVTIANLFAALAKMMFAEDAGASDTYTATLSPAPTAYVAGQHYRFKANTANTGAATINFNGLGAKTIKKAAGGITTDLADNDIRAGQWVDLVYDGTNMQMQSQLGNVSSGGSPGAHASTHENGGGDELSVAGLSGVLADPQVPITENVQDIVGAMVVAGTNVTVTYNDGAGTLTIDSTGGGGSIAPLVVEDANTVAQRNGANSQSFFVYGTFTSGTNYERANVGILSGTVVGIASEKGSGGGSVRDVALKRDTVSVTLSSGAFLPSNNNATDLGGGSNRWKDAYVVRGLFDTINLSTGGNKAILSDPSGRLFGGTLRVQDGAGNPGTFAGTDSTRSAFGSNQNDYSMEGQISYMQRWSSDASRDVTGISVSQVSGQMHLIVNVGSNNIVLKHESASSSAANRFMCSTGADITLGANQAADINYDSASQRWRVFKRN